MSVQNRDITQDEFFTPTDFISQYLNIDTIGNENYIDRNAGHGAWLCIVRDAKVNNGIPLEQALEQIYATEYFVDNCIQLIKNLYGDGDIQVLENDNIPTKYQKPGVKACFEYNGVFLTNIVCCDATEYDYTFGENLVFGNGLFEEE